MRNLKLPFFLLLAMLTISSCKNDDDDNVTTNTTEVKLMLTDYVNNVVRSTYHNLADATIELETACKTLQGSKTQVNVQNATTAWLKARKYWEQSEAFLYGPATLRGIDPHIDSWPLDKTNLDNLLGNATIMAGFDADYATNNLTGGLLGFHALEYVLFRDGGERSISDISDNELKYAVGVAGDLKLQCITLEAAWSGLSNVTEAKQNILNDAEVYLDTNWGDNVINAGEAGSTYKTQKEAILEIIQGEKGCRGIANEVGNTKITDPVNSGNVLDVESWYSWNSKEDFQDNIRGIQNSIIPILSYIKGIDETGTTKLTAAIANTIGEDGKTGIGTISYPFRNHLTKSECQTAIDACNNLVSILDEIAVKINQ
jgi:hypothetical protein